MTIQTDPEFLALFDRITSPAPMVAGIALATASMIASMVLSGSAEFARWACWPEAVISGWIPYAFEERAALARRTRRSQAEAERLRDAADLGALRAIEALGLPVVASESTEARQRGVRALARAAGVLRLYGNVQNQVSA